LTKEQRQYNRKKVGFLTSGAEQLNIHVQKRKKNIDRDFATFVKINSKSVTDISVNAKLQNS